MNPVGNNPYTISTFMKDPQSYQETINSYETDGFLGGGAILVPKQYYLNVELGSEESSFWQKYSLQMDISIDNRLSQRMALTNLVVSDESSSFKEYYFLTKKQRFLEANIGLRRRWCLNKRF